jgi:hypothetical protein
MPKIRGPAFFWIAAWLGPKWASRDRRSKDYTEVLKDSTLHRDTRTAVLQNCAITWDAAGKYREAEGDLDEILSSRPLSADSEALALISRALLNEKSSLT